MDVGAGDALWLDGKRGPVQKFDESLDGVRLSAAGRAVQYDRGREEDAEPAIAFFVEHDIDNVIVEESFYLRTPGKGESGFGLRAGRKEILPGQCLFGGQGDSRIANEFLEDWSRYPRQEF